MIAILVLHDMGIVHHDVKPTNILVDSDGHCVLTDYGGSCFISPPTSRTMRTSIPTPPATLQTHHMHNNDDIGEKTHQSYRDHRNQQQDQEKQEQQQQEQQSKHVPIITLRYAAPEVLLNGRDGQVIDYASDFWSLGVTLFELASGQVNIFLLLLFPLYHFLFLRMGRGIVVVNFESYKNLTNLSSSA